MGKQENFKFWNIRNISPEVGEIIIYGEIASSKYSQSSDIVTHKEFVKELTALGDVSEIVVRINSGGGSVTAANAIYTRLRDHQAKITVKIDGFAASAATIIAMAGDVILIPENGYFMIHDPAMSIYGYLNKEECTKLVNTLDTIRKGIISTYQGRTGLSEEEISEIMRVETWYTGKEAVEAGFCDELMFCELETTVENNGCVAINSVTMNPREYKNIPDSLKMLLNPSPPSKSLERGSDFTNKRLKKDVEEMEIKNLEEFQAKYPELYEQLRNKVTAQAVEGERKRISDIEDVAIGGYETMVEEAKFTSGIQASELAMKIMADQKKQGGQYLADRDSDAKNSNAGTEGVGKLSHEDKKSDNEALDVVNKLFDQGK